MNPFRSVCARLRKFAPWPTLALLGLGLFSTVSCSKPPPTEAVDSTNPANRINKELLARLALLENQERQLNDSLWAPEIMAQHQAQLFESLWDDVNVATNKLQVIARFPVGTVLLGEWSASHLQHGIQLHLPSAPGRLLAPSDWKPWLLQFESNGWLLGELEFRHIRFTVDSEGHPQESTFYFAAQCHNPAQKQQVIIEGDLIVHWSLPDPSGHAAAVRHIDASRLTLKSRIGRSPFEGRVLDQLLPPPHSESIDPIIAYDLDRDGDPEIIAAAKNSVYRRITGSFAYQSEPLCASPISTLYTAVIGDFDRDGSSDFLVAGLEGLTLFCGSGGLTFDGPGRTIFPAPAGWLYPMALTAGDIDADGDLDLFLGQYRVPYERGSLPTPYYDANDGHPAYLLLNDGQAGFTDATQSANLDAKRWRRTYSASFADLDADGHLDLVVVSDFAGVDLYRNNGRGQFTDVTAAWIPNPRAFGMAHAVADFNADGRLDLLMIGMNSPTVDRLQHMNLWHPADTDTTVPLSMVYGNRLYLARPNGGFSQETSSDHVARSGWSWGCAAFDFDNDSFLDLFIANGLESRSSVRDYESQFWLHDRFVGSSQNSPDAYLYFQSKFGRTRGRGQSYGGYERNRFYWNQSGAGFLEIGHLLGLALQEDARHALATDLDGDGRLDLIVTGFEQWPASKLILRLYRNVSDPPANWIGFRLHEQSRRLSPIGATVIIRYAGRTAVRQLLTGDSYRAQQTGTVHFGLGSHHLVEYAEIRWPGGQSITLPQPALNQYHPVQAPLAER